ncbi:MAG TPA: diacylglycerol kinase family protein, partial [Chthoniobacterales bacterium]|nr:diacylglycerol kinase family protein [Chthoniobacterales bacterium]
LRSGGLKKSPTEHLKDTAVILNPAARGQRAKRLRARLEALTDGCILLATSRCGDAECLARDAVSEGFRRIIAAGGDGTVNEVVNGIAGSDAALGLLPLGTMNVFATELGLPNDLDKCWAIIQADETRLVDLPRANGKHFVQLAGIGLDAQVVKETSLAFKRSFGPLSYLVSAAQISARPPPRLRVEAGDRGDYEGSFVLIGNGRLYGGPFPFFKQAVIDDGLFDVLVFKKLSYLDMMRYLQDVIFRSEITSPEVEYLQTTSVRVTSEDAVPVEIDGELIGHCPVQFNIQPRGLRVFAPAAWQQ